MSMLLFSLDVGQSVGPSLATELELELAPYEERVFEDGEQKLRPLINPRGRDVYVVSSLHGVPEIAKQGGRSVGGVNDKLMRLMLFCAALRDHGAANVTAVIPYLAYARKDERTQPFDPVSLRYVAQLLEAAGVQALLTLEPHNTAAFDNAFRIPAQRLDPGGLFVGTAEWLAGSGPVVVASPDIGGIKRAQRWRELLERRWHHTVGQAFVDKRRRDGRISSEHAVVGHVVNATVLLLDDMISTGATLRNAAVSLRQAGAGRVLAFAAHGLFNGPETEGLADGLIERIFTTDSVSRAHLKETPLQRQVETLSCAPVFARAIRERHLHERAAA